MAYYKTCPNCGCNLDPGERCDCEKEKKEQRKLREKFLNQHLCIDENGQLTFVFKCLKGGVAKE